MGGSLALCIPEVGLSVAIVINQLSLIQKTATKGIMTAILKEYGVEWLSEYGNVDMGM